MDWHIQSLIRELDRVHVEHACFPITSFSTRISGSPRVVCAGYDLGEFDAVLVRGLPGGSLDQIIFRMDTLHRLENLGVKVINSASAIERSVDKYYTSTLLEDAGILTPRTITTESFRSAVQAFDELGGDVVVKPLFGSFGVGMVRVDDRDVAHRVFKALQLARNVFYVQEFIPHGNQDIRAFVIGEKLIASMLRVGESWKTNIARGAKPKPYKLSTKLEKLCVKASKVVGCDYAGIDILKSMKDGRFYVTEINSTPGWEGLQTATETNVARSLIEYIIQLCSR
jgi:RimK family alpha-L-glutamate ligase